jgi:ABC-type multidrug transport system ATPase subunit
MEKTGATTLVWKDLSYSIADKKSSDGRKLILHPQAGAAKPGDLIALMGPSGSGKTSLLNAIAGRLPLTRGAQFGGSLEVNGVPMQELPCSFADISAYVEQDDALFPLSTVQETLFFQARLRLPSTTSQEEHDKTIEDVLRQLGLLHVRNTNVGGNSFNGALRGISGGERKRLSIGIELLHGPRCIFLDEPTTGLDSYQALNVMDKMRELARAGHTVMTSIHQPRSSIFGMLTGMYLLARGKMTYVGDSDAAAIYFGKLGFPLPPNFNPADFFIDLVSVDQRDDEALKSTEERLKNLQEAWADHQARNFTTNDPSAAGYKERRQSILEAKTPKPAGQHEFFMPFLLLLKRSWREQMRDKFALIFKILFMAFFALIFGLVYFQLDRTQKSIQDRTGILFFLTMNQAFGAVIGCSQVIPRQLAVVQRERANRLYAILPFYISNLLVSLPLEALPQLANNLVVYYMADLGGSFWIFFAILLLENFVGISIGMSLSASFSSVTMAPQLAPAVVILFLLFNGFMINEESIPAYFIWLREISFVRYAFKAVVVNEFQGASFTCSATDTVCITSGDAVLERLQFNGSGLIWESAMILIILAVAFNVVAYIILLLRQPKFLPIQSAPPTNIKMAEDDQVAVVSV